MPFFKDLLRDGAKINSLSENLENSLFFVSFMCKLIKLIYNRVNYRQSDQETKNLLSFYWKIKQNTIKKINQMDSMSFMWQLNTTMLTF